MRRVSGRYASQDRRYGDAVVNLHRCTICDGTNAEAIGQPSPTTCRLCGADLEAQRVAIDGKTFDALIVKADKNGQERANFLGNSHRAYGQAVSQKLAQAALWQRSKKYQ